MVAQSPAARLLKFLGSVKTGIVLLILVVIVSAAGTFILQRPLTDASDLERAYSPETLQWLDRLGLTNVFHAWWFALLLALVSVSIVLASIERFPKAWKNFSRPYLRPEPHFRAVLPIQAKLAVGNPEAAVGAAERAFRNAGFKPRRIGEGSETSLYAERNRWSVLAVYVVHTSLLLIFAGGIIDAFWGYRGFVALTPGQSVNQIELQGRGNKQLPFTLRCDGTGQENYPDGTPKKWWSKLAVIENGRETHRKEIVVNDPLVHSGIRFFQASYGSTGELGRVVVQATPKSNPSRGTLLKLAAGEPVALDADTSVGVGRFIPDFVVRDGEIYARSNQPNNPAIELLVESKKSGKTANVWLFPMVADAPQPVETAYDFRVTDLEMQPYTGLQVSYEPGQWAVWGGCVLMGIGLVLAFYCVHRRLWAVSLVEANGATSLWLGTQADKNREHYEEEFRRIVDEIRASLGTQGATKAKADEKTLVTV